jgi:hypothetical protein
VTSVKAAFVLVTFAAIMMRAEVRRALLVGIDEYMEPSPAYKRSEMTRVRLKAIHGSPSRSRLDSLEGAFNDARAMKEMLIQKFGFEESNIITLPNAKQAATADSILGLLQSFLIDGAQAGDVSLFYYAGHGSRIRNLATKNASGFDSTIIPADALLGVPDIRSKELARIYAQAPRKHVALTVIQDSCFSGAAARGAIARNRQRAQPPDLAISVNETLDSPLPEDAGVLVISASQEYEPAVELSSTDLNGPHGAFTWALLHVLGTSPADDRVDRVFQRARALMQSRAPGQEPVLLAKNGLNARGLFGQLARAGQGVAIAAGRVNASQVKLNGGLAMNLHEGCELERIQPPASAAMPVRVRVIKVNGLSSSDAVIVDGAGVREGDLFQMDKWVAPDRETLRVFIGAAAPPDEEQSAVAAAKELRLRGMLDEDPTVHSPTHIVQWDRSRWTLRKNFPGAKGAAIELGRLPQALPAEALVNVMIPAPKNLFDGSFKGSVAITESADNADYVLLGRAGAQSIEYAWALPDVREEDLLGRHSMHTLRSDWIAWNRANAAQNESALSEAALTLARVAGWLALSESGGGSTWLYHLALERQGSGRLLERREVRGGERYRLVLTADPELLRKPEFIMPRRVYVFVVDSWGHATLVVGKANLENEFPRFDAAAPAPPQRIELPESNFDIRAPYGVDHYFLLTTGNPIDSPETILNFEGARTRGATSSPTDPLARLLRFTATGTRGAVAQVPVNWSIEELSIVSRPPQRK